MLILALASLVGCQGVSGSSSSNQQPAPSGDLGLNHSSLSFGSVVIGSSSTLTVTATNSGTAAVTISAATFSVPQFSLSAPKLPATVSAGQSVSLSVVFTPSASGNVTGNVSLTNNSSNGTVTASLSGSGITPGSLSVNPSSLDFGSVQVGSSQQQVTTLTNTGAASLTVSQATVSGTGFSLSGLTLPVTLTGGQSTNLTVTFTPQSASSVSGSITITSNAPNPTLTVPLSGTGTSSSGGGGSPGVLSANPTSLSFGSVQVGNSQSLSEVVSNTGGSNVTISQDTVTGSGFSVSGFTPPLTLTPGQNYTFSVIYAPQSSGSASGNVSIASNASDSSLSISLSGTATAAGQLAVSPTSLSFSGVVVGTSASQTATLNASGSAVTVNSDTFSGSEFSLSGLTLPTTIQAGGQATFTITFTPQSTGTANVSLSFASNAANTPTVQTLTGTGSAPPVHTVALSWTASSSSNVTSYNIYRSTTSGSFSPPAFASVSAPTTTYTDTSVTDGVTYYYVTTAVDSSNQESGYSNQATAVIPPP